MKVVVVDALHIVFKYSPAALLLFEIVLFFMHFFKRGPVVIEVVTVRHADADQSKGSNDTEHPGE